jgi:uncharacterized membrane protein
MTSQIWAAIATSFLASFVEVVEAFTILLAVGTFQGWRPVWWGTLAALTLLVALVFAFGPLLGLVPIRLLQFVVGVLLLLFGLRWLRKAILRSAGVIPMHDELAAFGEETAHLEEAARRSRNQRDWIAGMTAFKAVLLEGIEVIFVVVAIGAGHGTVLPASLGAFAACALVMTVGLILHKPLSRVPENTLKFAVGVLLAAFGVFWTGEGLGIEWPGHDLAILVFAVVYLLAGQILARMVRTTAQGVRP